MRFEDAREYVAAAGTLLLSRREELQLPELTLHRLTDFLEQAERVPLTLSEKENLVDQAILVMDQLYAHLPFKRARYGVDPVQRLRLLRVRAGSLSERAFHSELLAIFVSVRDAHTFYGLPDPYRGAMAFLPFDMEWYGSEADSTPRHFVIYSVMEGFSHPYFGPTAEILAWNGIPMERAVLAVAELEPGGNEAAKFSRGLDAMTLRPLTFSLPPDGHYVTIEYIAAERTRGGRQPRGIVLPWTVAEGFGHSLFRSSGAVSMADSRYQMRSVQKLLWCREELLREYRGRAGEEIDLSSLNLNFYDAGPPTEGDSESADDAAAENNLQESTKETSSSASSSGAPEIRRNLNRDSVLPDAFEFCFPDSEPGDAGIAPSSLRLPGKLREKRFGYLRIKRFGAGVSDDGEGQFFEEFQRILDLMRDRAPDGLILDSRANPGGSIQDAEQLLQLLVPHTIQPQPFHFANTLLMQQLTQQVLHELRALDVERDNAESVSRISMASAELSVATADIPERVVSGSALAEGKSLSDPEAVNAVGQRYHGPVALLVDARSYSAADIFAAGFQDHEIGEVIGEDANTGGGGASRWTHQEDLVDVFGKTPGIPFQQLPRNASLAVAIRRCTRQGMRAGQALEDTGVVCDTVHARTRDDVLHHSRDLVQFACRRLAARTAYRLDVVRCQRDGPRLKVEMKSANLDRVEFLVDGRPQRSVALPRVCGKEFNVPLHGLPRDTATTLTLHGLARTDFRGRRDPDGDLTHVATLRVPIDSPA